MSHDLTFVAPERRSEVRRRIDAIERFLARPGRAMAESCAKDLGLCHAQFYNLVRAWRAKHAPEAMMGRHGTRAISPRIDQTVLDLIDEAISDNARATATAVIERIEALATERGLILPDPSTVSRYVRRKRPSLLTDEQRAGLDLIVDHTVIDLQVDFGDGHPRRPLATFVIDVASETPVGFAISQGTPGPAPIAVALLDALRRGIRHAHKRESMPSVGIVVMADIEAEVVIEAMEHAGFELHRIKAHAHSGGLFVESLLGRGHSGIRLKQRLVWHEGTRRTAALPTGSRALTPAEAEDIVRGRLFTGYPTLAFAGLGDVARSRLRNSLLGIVQAE